MDLTRIATALESLLELFQGADGAPTTQGASASGDLQRKLMDTLDRWNELKTKDLPALNDQLRQANLPVLKLE